MQNKIFLLPALLLVLESNAADLVQHDDYVSIRVEAEEYTNKDERWYLVSDTVDPGIEQDADGSHASLASASGYMEVLPDYRQTHEDSIVNGYWSVGGQGPEMSYTLNFPEAGRYMVYVRSYSTGTEDNSVHAGINGSWPIDAQALQVPCGPKNEWIWANNKRTEDNHCGDPDFPVYLDVPAAGAQTVSFSAREDGFELDSFFLIKNKSAENIICSPSSATEVSCQNGSFNFADGFVDVEMSLSAIDTSVREGETLTFTHTVSNKDKKDMATGIVISANLNDSMVFQTADSTDCSGGAGQMTCTVGNLAPKSSIEYQITYKFSEAAQLSYKVTSTTNETDENPANNAAALGVTVYSSGPVVDVNLSAGVDKNPVGLDAAVTYSFTINNTGLDLTPDANIIVTIPQAAKLLAHDDNCSPDMQIRCELGELAADSSKTVSIVLAYASSGKFNVSAIASATYDENSENDTVDVEVFASNGKMFEESEGKVAVEAEDFVLNQLGDDSGHSAWYLVSATEQPDTSDYNNTPIIDTASSQSYVVALGESSLVDSDKGAVLGYRVFFNSIGTYYLHARINQKDVDGGVLVTIDENMTNAKQVSMSCAGEAGWTWTDATEVNSQCQADTPVMFDITTPGEHIVSFSVRDSVLELDKFVLSSNSDEILDDIGPDAVEYTDKNLDLDLKLSPDQLALSIDEAADIVLTLTNNHSTAAASNVRLTLSGLQGIELESESNSDCAVEEDQGADMQSLVCKLPSLSPSESRSVVVPIKILVAGSYEAKISVTADQSDDQISNNSQSFTVTVASLGAAGSGSGGGVVWIFIALMALVVSGRQCIIYRKTSLA